MYDEQRGRDLIEAIEELQMVEYAAERSHVQAVSVAEIALIRALKVILRLLIDA